MAAETIERDYSLIGRDAKRAEERGLANAEWYRCPIPRARLKELMKRKDGPAIRDTAIWIAAFIVTGGLAVTFFPSWASLPFFLAYGVLYGSSTDSRWHECGHRTAFKTIWMNDAVYHLACFMVMREPTVWRWSHTRHHTDTIIVGRDPEIAVMRPTVVLKVASMFLAIPQVTGAIRKMGLHAAGRLDPEEATFIPATERHRVYAIARIWLAIHLAVIGLAIATGSWLPVLLAGPLPTMYGAWLHVIWGLTQHAGLAEDVLDQPIDDGIWSAALVRGELNELLKRDAAGGYYRLKDLGGVLGDVLRSVHLESYGPDGVLERHLFADRLRILPQEQGMLLQLEDGAQMRGEEKAAFLDGRYRIFLPHADREEWAARGIPGVAE